MTYLQLDYDCVRCFEKLQQDHPNDVVLRRMIGCQICGNKRCPKATDHALECTGSNEPGQMGSVFK